MKTAEKIITVGDDKYHYNAGYYAQNKWADNDTLILDRAENEVVGNIQPKGEKIYETVKYSLKDGSIDVLARTRSMYSNVTYGNKVFYCDENRLNSIELESGRKRIVYEYPGKEWLGMPHITADGKYINMSAGNKIVVVDSETGAGGVVFSKSFNDPFPVANHFMICPTDSNIIYFAHEGNTFYVSNRLWLVNIREQKAWNLAKQNLDKDGNLGDCFGHEAWAPDGKGMYFVKYPCSPTPPRGICYVDRESGRHEVLYSKFNYWHVGVSADGKYLLADTTDTGNDRSEVVVIDRQDGSETCIDNPRISWVHPCHPHPQMSPGDDKVVYTALGDNGKICVKTAYLK